MASNYHAVKVIFTEQGRKCAHGGKKGGQKGECILNVESESQEEAVRMTRETFPKEDGYKVEPCPS